MTNLQTRQRPSIVGAMLAIAIAFAASAARAEPAQAPMTEGVKSSDPELGSGVVAMVRIDVAGRCCAGGLGLSIALHDRLELDVDGLRSNDWGAYFGVRYRFLTGWLRPFAAGGAPVFVFTNDMSTQIAPGLRVAGGVEIVINRHFGIEGDIGVEHFFNVDGTSFEPTVWVPTIGAIGRL